MPATSNKLCCVMVFLQFREISVVSCRATVDEHTFVSDEWIGCTVSSYSNLIAEEIKVSAHVESRARFNLARHNLPLG